MKATVFTARFIDLYLLLLATSFVRFSGELHVKTELESEYQNL